MRTKPRGGRNHGWSGIATPNGKHRNGVKFGEVHVRFPGPPCRTLRDMSEPEIVALERLYGCPVIRPAARYAGLS